MVGVQPGSPAHEAGVRPGDFLLAIDGIPVYTQPPSASVRELWVQDAARVSLTLGRAGSTIVVTLP